MRREYSGGAAPTYLTSALGSSTADLTISCSDLANWRIGGGTNPFFVVIDRGTLVEEKILCSSRSANTITVYNDGITVGRGADDTNIVSHGVNAIIEHVFTATDADEANLHVNTTGNPHGTIVNYYQPSAPSSPNTGDLWVDSDVTA
jgi:hypothetical protein